jgi:DNA-binding XRE family transcriptional regulator
MKHDYMTGAELQCLRESCGLDRDQFGELCGVQGRSIKYWEMGNSNHGVPADVSALVNELSAKVQAEAEAEIAAWRPGDVLLRTGNTMKNKVAQKVFIARMAEGARVVAFDLTAFRAWLGASKDTPGARQQWARIAVKDQAKPHRSDQPA